MSRLNLALNVKHAAQMVQGSREEDPLLLMSFLVAMTLDVDVVLSVILFERNTTWCDTVSVSRWISAIGFENYGFWPNLDERVRCKFVV